MTARFGIKKLILINSAGYERATIPLDKSISVYAPNNYGKSSLVNALQWLLVHDVKSMNFDGHNIDKSKRYYFGTDSSYVMAELNLPTGKFVLGAAGKGKLDGFGHRFFVYPAPGGFEKSQIITYSDSYVRFKDLKAHLASLGIFEYYVFPHTKELSLALMGGKWKHSHTMDLTLIPLENTRQVNVYRDLIKSLLALGKMSAKDAKKLILKTFKNELDDTHGKLDFDALWESEFEAFRKQRHKIEILSLNREKIQEAHKSHLACAQIRGQLMSLGRAIDAALLNYEQNYESLVLINEDKIKGLNEQLEQLKEKQQNINDRQGQTINALQQVVEKITKHDQLAVQFSLLSKETLVANIQHSKAAYEQLSSMGVNASTRAKPALEAALVRAKQLSTSIQSRMDNTGETLLETIIKPISTKQSQLALLQLINADVLYAGQNIVTVADHEHLKASLKEFDESISETHIHVFGLRFVKPLLPVVPVMASLNTTELKAELVNAQQDVKDLTATLKLKENLKNHKVEKDKKYKLLQDDEAALTHYKIFIQLAAGQSTTKAAKKQLTQQLADIKKDSDNVFTVMSQLNESKSGVKKLLEGLTRQKHAIDQDKVNRERLSFSFDKELVFATEIYPLIPFTELLDDLRKEKRYVDNLRSEQHCIRSVLIEFESKLPEYNSLKENERLNKFHELVENLDEQKEILNQEATTALHNISNSLSALIGDLHRITGCISDLNKTFTKLKISNLQAFELEAVKQAPLIDAIEAITANTGISLLNYAHPDLSDDVEAAKSAITAFCAEGNGLKLEDLFDIRYRIVDSKGKEERVSSFNDLGSNGTRVTVRTILSMLLLNCLVPVAERGRFGTVFYLDEAADLDPENQAQIIELSTSLGMVPVFASVQAQPACDYSVSVLPEVGKNEAVIDLDDVEHWTTSMTDNV